MTVGHFHIPGDSTRRRYAVYIMVARHRESGRRLFYAGKTGDNFVGCNPVISRAGNHFSYNRLHSQMRNLIGSPENYDFDYFYTTFADYVPPSETRTHVDQINDFERHLNRRAQEAFGAALLNPYRGRRRLSPEANPEQIDALIKKVVEFVRDGQP